MKLAGARSGSPEGPRQRPILIVDDDGEHRAVCRELLEQSGYTVEDVANGHEAVHRLIDRSKPEPCLILLDLSMPVLSGWELLAILKSYPRLHAIPVVLLSAHEPGLDPVRHGTIVAHVRKPYDAQVVLALAAKFSQAC